MNRASTENILNIWNDKMDINATLFGQMITFAIFIWFTVKFVWPPVIKALEARRKQIADGIAASERSQQELKIAKHKASEIIDEAKAQASVIMEQANKRCVQIEEEAKAGARKTVARMKDSAKLEMENEITKVKQALRKEVVELALSGAEKLIEHNIDEAANQEILKKLATEI